ncbi:Histidine kinase-, DNA gyrase B-, and HSP90-like ATPase [Blastococcus sp. DSM 46786]|uniref:sensor histidine kinase n=1 Tax=Blastococcus sp. DSM 46786 TaxID=1798227 RepID=UPI0008BEA2FF|nr:sensor histidine kinase [Blastococcus sp. DSM 46786]SEK82290.1 Histidine kinase-, DNA gyrase B-, and HSP90-like ATPase [Blastococcus sp. DSM 46786]
MTTRVTAPAPAPPRRAAGGRPPGAAVLPRLFAWAVLPVYLAGAVAYLVLDARLGGPGLDPAEAVPILGGFGLFAALGALLVLRRPHNAVGWLMASAALLVGVVPAGDAYAAWVMTTRGRPDALAVAGAWLQSWYWYAVLGLLFLYLPLLFPDGRLPSPRWWPVAVLPGAALGAICVLGMLTGSLSGQEVDYRIDNPIGVPGLAPVEELPVFAVLGIVLAAGIIGAVVSVVVRFRRSRGDERLQMTWFLFAVAPAVLAPLDGVLPLVSSAVFVWLLLALPVAIAVAVLKYRLEGIDVVLNRTLVYGTLTALVVGGYVLVVGYLGAVLRRDDDLLVSLVATGLVAVGFAPAHDRLQRGVNRLLYGRRTEPYAALSRLGERLESTLAPDDVLPAIVTTVRESLRLPYAAIVLGDGEPAVESGSPVPGTRSLPLLYRSEEVGELRLGLRPGETAFSAADRRLLSDLARQAGVAVSAVRLTADLRRSRERLVTAREEERRRLRRDLHDGLGAQLAGLTVQTGVLRTLIHRDPARAEALAGELRAELRTAIADVRRLVHDLRPPALDELGLVGALERLTERCSADGDGLRAGVEVDGELPPLPAAVEVAAYRIAQEALTNVVRHAAARTCTLRLAADDGELTVEVVDDGRGLPAELLPGVGMSSMRERAAETGGRCDVLPAPGSGTRVRARLPLSGGH